MNGNTRKIAYANLLLNTIWGITSLILLFAVFYFSGQKEKLQLKEQLTVAADEISNSVDNLVDDLTQTVLGNLNDSISDCNAQLIATLKHTIFNTPEISGIVIKNARNDYLCGTLEHNDHTPIIKDRAVSLNGPLQLSDTDKPAFIIQQKLGHYYIQIYILETVLAKALHSSSPLVQWISLRDSSKNAIILHMTQKNGVWFTDNKSTPLHDPHKITTDLNLDHFQIVLSPNLELVSRFTWHHEVFAFILILIFSILIYGLLRHIINQHFSVHRALVNAIRTHKFFPVFQPIFDTSNNKYIGAEILLRWHTDDGEVIMPDLFIEDAEKNGLIIPITLQLMEKAFQRYHDLLAINQQFHLAINLSATHLSDHHFLNSFFMLCEKFNIIPSQLMLEITERDLLRLDDKLLVASMHELRLKGFSLAIDDFGTGHASISYLQHFPFNYLKIDQIFVSAIGTGAITETLNQSIIQMAKNLQLHIIAEGVETRAQQVYLQQHEVHLMQGWHFAKAMPIEQLIQLITVV